MASRDELAAAYATLLFDKLSQQAVTTLNKRVDPRTADPVGWPAVKQFVANVLTSPAATAAILPPLLEAVAVLDRALYVSPFLGGAFPAAADLVVYFAAWPVFAAMTHDQRAAVCNASRWLDHLQHLVLDPPAQPPADMPPPLRVRFDLDVPATPGPLRFVTPDGATVVVGSSAPPSGARTTECGGRGADAHGDNTSAKANGADAGGGGGGGAGGLGGGGKKEKKVKGGAAADDGGRKAATSDGGAKAKGGAAAGAAGADGGRDRSDLSRMDLRVGLVKEAERHPEADNLYVEKIDLGDAAPRTVVSGLAQFVPLEDLRDSLVVVVCNLKPATMKGVESAGMVLCASDADKTTVEVVRPPLGCTPGERVAFQGHPGEPEANPNVIKKKKIWEAVAPGLRTDEACVATFEGVPFGTSKGPCAVKSLKNAAIK